MPSDKNRPIPSNLCDSFVPPHRTGNRARVAFVDTETTGLDVSSDEVIQVAIVRLDGTVAYSQLLRPVRAKRWDDAMAVNHITPEMVSECPTLLDEKERIEAVLGSIDSLVGWNVRYDIEMLYAGGIDFPDGVEFCDLMPTFCDVWRKGHPDYPEDRNRERLVRVTEWLGIRHNAHDALGDTEVLVPIWDWVAERMGNG